MLRIALTGGIATGKTYVARRLAAAGVPVADADELARKVVAPGTPALAAIEARFGAGVLRPDGSLDRKRLGEIVFSDAVARRDLEAITHPAVRTEIDRFFADLPSTTILAAADIPLLFETGREGDFDRVLVAACRPEIQMDRLMKRDGLTREQAERRLAAQLPIAEKVARADDVIWTTGSFEETDAQVKELIDRLAR
jgi:dephospho-CoA kinase